MWDTDQRKYTNSNHYNDNNMMNTLCCHTHRIYIRVVIQCRRQPLGKGHYMILNIQMRWLERHQGQWSCGLVAGR
jgi:hypothetical protein